jgi:glutamine amidotransferase
MGQHEGLHIIPGEVLRFPEKMEDPFVPGRTLRVPQIGWNQLHQQHADDLLAGVPDGAYAYFAHSYYCKPTSSEALLATTDYGFDYASIVRYKNAWGIQPHPEKSHTVGLRILSNFMQMVAASGVDSSSSESVVTTIVTS